MLNKKQIKGLSRKVATIFVVSVVILCTMVLAPGVLAPKPAKAAVTVSSISGAPPGMMIGPGMLFSALGINVVSDAVEVSLTEPPELSEPTPPAEPATVEETPGTQKPIDWWTIGTIISVAVAGCSMITAGIVRFRNRRRS